MKLPRAILFDLDDTILVVFGPAQSQWQRTMRWKCSVGPDETWMVGDNLEWEIMTLQRLGIYAIWLDGYGVGLPRNSPIRPDRIIRRLSELLL
jgi:FMN phosphatase YigB (HAD superfamily)